MSRERSREPAGSTGAGLEETLQEPADWTRLRFVNASLERQFRADYARRSLRQVRISLALGGLLYAAFGALDPWIIPTATAQAWWIRYGVVCPLLLLAMLLSYRPVFLRRMQVAMTLVGLVAGFGILGMIVLAAPPGSYLYYAGLLLVCTFVWTFMRLRFVPAAIACLAIMGSYEPIAYLTTPASIFVNNTFFMLSFNVVGMSACYYMERYARADFLQQRVIERQAAQLGEALESMERAREQAEQQARHDALTGLFNRRPFLTALAHEMARSKRYRTAVAAILLDIDHFKRINDSLGHAVGDRVLVDVAQRIVRNIREVDVACRYGGEEFAILLPGADMPEATAVAERLRRGIEELQVPGSGLQLTASLGVAVAGSGRAPAGEAMLERADRAMYAAKRAGRNRVVPWQGEDPQSSVPDRA